MTAAEDRAERLHDLYSDVRDFVRSMSAAGGDAADMAGDAMDSLDELLAEATRGAYALELVEDMRRALRKYEGGDRP